MVAVPLLGGAALRLVLGMMTDHWGARRTAIIGMLLTLSRCCSVGCGPTVLPRSCSLD